LPLARRLVNGRERGCLQVVPCIVLRLVNMSTRAMRLKTQARVLACLQVVYPNLSVVKEQSLSASLVRLEKELFPLYLETAFGSDLRSVDTLRGSRYALRQPDAFGAGESRATTKSWPGGESRDARLSAARPISA